MRLVFEYRVAKEWDGLNKFGGWSKESFTWTLVVVLTPRNDSFLRSIPIWCVVLEDLGSNWVRTKRAHLKSFSVFLLLASLTISLSFLTHAADVLFIINRLGHLRGRGRLWAEIQLLKVDSLIRLFYSFCLSDSLIYRFMLRILDLWAGPEVLNPRYYFSWLRRGHFRSELRWFFEWRRTTDHVTH